MHATPLIDRPPRLQAPSALQLEGRVALRDWGVMRASGADAAAFLQGQLSNDVAALTADQACLAGYCSAKGRLLASLVVWRPEPDVFMMACSADLVAATIKRLSMFVLRSKCRIEDAATLGHLQGRWSVMEGSTNSAQAAAPTGLHRDGLLSRGAVNVGDQAFAMQWQWVPGALGETVPSDDVRQADLHASWRWLEVASGHPRVVASTADAFVPQMVNFELVGGVNFRKGCYPGQEVVARSQYRGTLKRRMHLFEGHDALRAGEDIFHDSDPTQPVGSVVNAATLGTSTLALISLKTAVLSATTTLHPPPDAGPSGAALIRRAMPYDVPNDAT